MIIGFPDYILSGNGLNEENDRGNKEKILVAPVVVELRDFWFFFDRQRIQRPFRTLQHDR